MFSPHVSTIIRSLRRLALTGVLFAALPGLCAQQPAAGRAAPPKIVLKLDDLTGMHPNWQKVVESLDRRGIKAGFGIICNSLEHPKPEYLKWLKDTQAGGRVEFWCHGYDHKQWTQDGLTLWEFYGAPLAQQKQHLERCQELARATLGAPFASFGAPFNQTDEKFAEVIRDSPDFKVWMYGDGQFPMGKTVLVRVGGVNIEDPIFHPSTDKLAQGMSKHPGNPYFVIQGHPPQWDAPRLAEFEKMLDYLTAQKAVFMTPSELAATLPPPGPAGPLPPPSKPVKAPVATAAGKPVVLPPGQPIGTNLIENGDFAAGMDGWNLDRTNNTPAEVAVEDAEGGKHAAHVKVPEAGEKRFYVQLSAKNKFPIADGKTYTLSFRAHAKPAAQIVVVVASVQGGWEALARQDQIQLNEIWTDYSFTVAPAHASTAAALSISGLAAQPGEFWFTDVSFKENK